MQANDVKKKKKAAPVSRGSGRTGNSRCMRGPRQQRGRLARDEEMRKGNERK